MSSAKRLLDPKLLPQSLWDAVSKVLHLPPELSNLYKSLIERHGLQKIAITRDHKNPPVGGLDQEKTDQHFAQAFDGSVARTQLALLDPNLDVPNVSNAFINCLAGNTVSITDAPCGAGAAAYSFLSSVAELRNNNVLPREPLDIVLIGAELSKPARAYAEEILSEILPFLEEQAIFVTAEFLEWDATDSLSTTDLIRRLTVSSVDVRKRLLIVANFSAFLEKEKKRKDAQAQIEELFRHAYGDNSVAIWIEPDMNRATGEGGLFSWLRKLMEGPWSLFAREDSGMVSEPISTSSARFQLPLIPSETARVGLSVMKLNLIRSK